MASRTLEYEGTGNLGFLTREGVRTREIKSKTIYGDFTPEEKDQLWDAIKSWRKLVGLDFDSLSQEQIRDYFRGETALKTVINTNRGWVCKLGIAIVGTDNFARAKEDLIQVGNMAIFKAAMKYDRKKGGFLTYATHTVVSDFQHCSYYPKSEFGVSYDSRQKKNYYIVIEAIKELRKQELPLTAEILCNKTGLGKTIVRHILQSMRVFAITLTEQMEESYTTGQLEGPAKEEIVFDGQNGRPVEEVALDNITAGVIDQLIEIRMSKRERKVVRMSSGLLDDTPRSNREIGERLGLSSEAIRLIKTREDLQKAILHLVDTVTS